MLGGWLDGGEPGGGPSTGTVTLVRGQTFCVSDRSGDIRPATSQGLFVADIRVLDRAELRVDGLPLELLSLEQSDPLAATSVLRGPVKPGAAHSDLLVLRSRAVADRRLGEQIDVRNYGSDGRVRFAVELELGADFADLFSVKAGHPRGHGSTELAVDDGTVELRWRGDRSRRTLRITTSGAAVRADEALALCWDTELPAGHGAVLSWEATTDVGEIEPHPVGRLDGLHGAGAGGRATVPPPLERVRVTTRPRGFERALLRGLADVDGLKLTDPQLSRPIVAAGAPWFMTLFGRDALLTAWMMLPVDPELALGALEALALLQGDGIDPETEEEPGRIVHEVRFHRAGTTSLLDGEPYYGTVDAPALYVMLLGELRRWGVSADHLAPFVTPADRALSWMEDFGDIDGDGLVEYQRRTPRGLANQGWKDSWDAIRYRDGRIARPPLAMCEVQAYAVAAYAARAELALGAGDAQLAERWRRRAHDARARLDERFWLPGEQRFALALDGDKQPVDAVASNPGLCLWAGAVAPDRAAAVARQLSGPELWSGWGVRTLGKANGGYNPMSYHCGSVWPHDTALCAEGLRRYGLADEMGTVATGLMSAASLTGGRLPELLCGLGADEVQAPVPYPTSCQPQAWAAASPWLVLRSVLGLDPDVTGGVVHLAPRLPDGLHRIEVDGLVIGGATVSVQADRDGGRIVGLPRHLRVV